MDLQENKNSYKYNVGYIIKDNNRELKILEQIKIKRSDETYRKGYKIKCLKDGYIYDVTESHLFNGQGCAVCSNKVILKDINSVWKTDIDKAINFNNIEDSYTKSRKSKSKVWIKCPCCGSLKYMKISTYITYGIMCPACSDGKSYAEKIMFSILKQLNIEFKNEYAPNWCRYNIGSIDKNGRYDFYFKLNNKEYIIEMDGGFHTNDNKMSGQTKEESKTIDNKKDNLAKEHNIEVIRIDCDYNNNNIKFEYIKNNIFNNCKLNSLFDLSKVDWIKANKFALNSMVMKVCELWKQGLNKIEITEYTQLSNSCVKTYLKKLSEFNLCDYDPKVEMQKNGAKNGKSTGKKIYCNEIDKYFNSVHDCSRYFDDILKIKLNVNGICRVCRKERNHYKNYTFEYV